MGQLLDELKKLLEDKVISGIETEAAAKLHEVIAALEARLTALEQKVESLLAK